MSIVRTPEPFWRNVGPKAPWGPFDPNATLDFSFDFGPWISSAGVGLTMVSCSVMADNRLQVMPKFLGSIITARICVAANQGVKEGTYLAITLSAVLSDGQRDDRTFYLLVRTR